MSYELKLTIPGLPKTANAGARRHWRAQMAHAQQWQKSVIVAVGSNRPPAPLQMARLVLTRVSSAEPDYDGLVSSFKPVIDGLIKAGVLANDKMQNIGRPEYNWEKGRRGHGSIRIEVLEPGIDETPRTG